MNSDRKKHWETVYETKGPEQVSWTQELPHTSLEFIRSFGLDKSASIIDVGGGDSKLVDHLLNEGYTNISVLDISAKALEKAKSRLGNRAAQVNWIVSDILDFEPSTSYDIWHDRASFHFLTTEDEIAHYVDLLKKAAADRLVIGTFSEEGPKRCSALDIHQYSEESLSNLLAENFSKISCLTEDHNTPFDTQQNFLFCSFKRK